MRPIDKYHRRFESCMRPAEVGVGLSLYFGLMRVIFIIGDDEDAFTRALGYLCIGFLLVAVPCFLLATYYFFRAAKEHRRDRST